MTPTLPDVKSKVVFDDSALTKASKTSAVAHGQMQEHAKASTTHTLRFQESLTTMMGHIGGMPPVLDTAGRSLESMASTGVTGMQLLGGVALAGFGLVAEGAKMAIDSYTKLGDQVENYKRVVGGSAEDAGKMVQTFEALGVSGDTATAAMFKFSKQVETHAAKLEALGIVIAHDASGNVNLSKTLLSVADAYNATADQGQKNTIVFDAFGKSGRDMIPILEQGSAALQALEASARLTFTDADLQRLKDLKIHQAEVKQGWDAMWETIGQKLLPAQDALSQSILRGEYVNKRLNEAVQAGTISQSDLSSQWTFATPKLTELKRKLDEQFDASQKVKSATDQLTQAATDHANALDAEWTAMDKVVSQEEASVNAGYALQLADLAVVESQGKVTQAYDRSQKAHAATLAAQDALDKATAQYGLGSEQSSAAYWSLQAAQAAEAQAIDDVTKASIEQGKAYYAGAAAARKLQEDTDLATTGQKNARLEAKAYIDKLQEEANTLAPGSPLRVNLQAYIDKLNNELPKDVTTNFHQNMPGPSYVQHNFAEGGSPPVGVPSWVGEKGPELFVPREAGTIIPHGAGGDMSETNSLLRQLIDVATAQPGGQTGTEAAIWKVMQAGGFNRLRGHAGA